LEDFSIFGIISGFITGVITSFIFEKKAKKENRKTLFTHNQQEYEKWFERLKVEVEIAFDEKNTNNLKRALYEEHTFYGFENINEEGLDKAFETLNDLKKKVDDKTFLQQNMHKILSELEHRRQDILLTKIHIIKSIVRSERVVEMDEKIRFILQLFLKKILKKPYVYSMIFILSCVFMPVIIWGMYLVGDNYIVLINTSLTVGDLLTFYGSNLAFIGTLILGSISVWQNKKVSINNERITKIEEERHLLEYQPFVIINSWILKMDNIINIIANQKTPKNLNVQISELKNANGICACLKLQFLNTSNSFSTVYYSGARMYDNNIFLSDWSNCIVGCNDCKLYLNTGEVGEIQFYADWDIMKDFIGKMARLDFTLENRYGEHFKETMDVHIIQMQDNGLEKEGYVYLHPQNYNIKKI
jgi:hypothetical protein